MHLLIYSSHTLARLRLKRFLPQTKHLFLNSNPDFGYDGLHSLLEGMLNWDQTARDLTLLDLAKCGLGEIEWSSFERTNFGRILSNQDLHYLVEHDFPAFETFNDCLQSEWRKLWELMGCYE